MIIHKVNLFKVVSVLLFVFAANFCFAKDSDTLNVLSWNVQTGSYYNSATTPAAVAEVVLENDIDFFGTQEQHVEGAAKIIALLSDYDWYGVGREDGDNEGETCTIIYKKTRFMLADTGTFWLSETPNVVGSKSWESQDIRIVSWCKFVKISDSNVVYMFDTHFDHVSSEARTESASLLRKKVDEIAGKNPVIITGDFNASNSSTAYSVMTQSYDDYLDIYDSKEISETDPEGPSGTYNSYSTDTPSSRIDYIFLNPFFDVKTYAVLTDKYDDGGYISDHFPIKIKVKVKYPTAPVTPTLTAVSGNSQIVLSWDNTSELETFTDSTNDFEGYKLYKSETPDMSDALLVADSWGVPLLRDPLLECDLDDDIYGYTNYGIVDGFGYYLGNDSGLQHFYIDKDVENGQVYYYVLLAYDYGIQDMADGFAPMETPFTLEVDNNGNVLKTSKNVAVATPDGTMPGTSDYVTFDSTDVMGTGDVSVIVSDPSEIAKKTYKLSFIVDTLDFNAVSNKKYRNDHDLYFVNSGFKIYSADDDSLIYYEDTLSYTAQNMLQNTYKNYRYLNTSGGVVSEQVEGFQVELNNLVEVGTFDSVKSGWLTGSSDIEVALSAEQAVYFPWNFEIRFGEEYTGLTNTTQGIYNTDGTVASFKELMLKETYDFTAISTDFEDEYLDMVTYDVNMNDKFDYGTDQILIGYCKKISNLTYWAGTVCALSFNDSTVLPQDGDVYQVVFKKPFLDTDEIVFSLDPNPATDVMDDPALPVEFELGQNYPNPFNPTTTIEYSIGEPGNYKLVIYNILGEKVTTLVNEYKTAGKYSVDFNAGRYGSGVYIYSLQGARKRITKKMMLLK